MELLDKDLLDSAIAAQQKIEDSGIGLITVETDNQNVIAAIERVFGVNTNTINFEMFKESIRLLRRVGILNGYSNI